MFPQTPILKSDTGLPRHSCQSDMLHLNIGESRNLDCSTTMNHIETLRSQDFAQHLKSLCGAGRTMKMMMAILTRNRDAPCLHKHVSCRTRCQQRYVRGRALLSRRLRSKRTIRTQRDAERRSHRARRASPPCGPNWMQHASLNKSMDSSPIDSWTAVTTGNDAP